MDAAPATEPSSNDPAEAGGGVNPDAGAAVPPKPQTVKIGGEDVELAVLQRHYDPECDEKCAEGVIIVGRPMPRGFKGVIRVPELCGCTIRGYRAAHPPAPLEPVIGARALAELEGRSRSKNDHSEKQAARLRAALAEKQAQLAETEMGYQSEIAALDEEAARAAIAIDVSKDLIAAAQADLEALRAQVHGAQARIGERQDELARDEMAAAAIAARRRDSEDRHAGVMKRAANLRSEIEKLERRLALAEQRDAIAKRGGARG